MAAPVFQTLNTQDGSLTFTKPTGLADGDTLILFVQCWKSATSSAATPSGFTFIGSVSNAYEAVPNYTVQDAFYKNITNAAGEPASYTVTNGSGSIYFNGGSLLRISGAHATTPIDDYGNNSVNYASPSSTWSTGAIVDTSQADALMITGVFSGGAAIGTGSATSRWSVDGGDTVGMTEALSAQQTAATFTGTIAASGPWSVLFVTIKPPGGAAPSAPTRNQFVRQAVKRAAYF